MEKKVYENEKWWQENGMGWMDEVEKRRSVQPLYGIQEVVLSDIFSKLPNGSKVMEFGVGFGRHVEYLDDLKNLEVHGVDQSPTMLESLKKRMPERVDLLNRIVLIEPRTKLPYPDNYFDIVYTVSVLIHIRPDHLPEILQELLRVSKHGILHFENNYVSSSKLVFEDHNGCWGHAIIEDYKNLHQYCRLLTKVAAEQDIYFVSLSADSRYQQVDNSVMYQRLRLIDERILPQLKEYEGEVGWRTVELKERIEKEFLLQQELKTIREEHLATKTELNALNQELGAIKQTSEQYEKRNKDLLEENHQIELLKENLESQVVELKSQVVELKSQVIYFNSQLEGIQSSLGWKLVNKLRGMEKLYVLTSPARSLIRKSRENKVIVSNESSNSSVVDSIRFEDEIKNPVISRLVPELDNIDRNSDLVIYQPEWLGVSNSTKELFESTLGVKEIHKKEHAQSIAELISSKEPRTITFSGFAIGYKDLAYYLKKLLPQLSIKVFWHGNTTHMYEDYSWVRYQEIIHLYRDGIINSLGFAKRSMAELYQLKGYNSFFVKNKVNIDFEKSSIVKPVRDWITIGLYASGNTWNKNAYTQIAAASLIDGAKINATPFNDRMRQFSEQLGVPLTGSTVTVPRDEMIAMMNENDINFYVTFSECAPMLPLESLEMGIPCITGPNHHFFEEESELQQYLVVNSPDDAVEIAQKAKVALDNRERIISLYQQWKLKNDKLSRMSIDEFLEREH